MTQTDPSPHLGSSLRYVIGFLKPYKTRVWLALLALLVAAAAMLALGQGIRYVIDQGFLAGSESKLNQALLLVLIINLIASVAVFARFYLMSWLGERVTADIRKQVYNHLLYLSPSFYEKTKTGEIISRFTSDTTVLETVIGSSLSMAIRSAITVLAGSVMMAITSLKLTLLVFLTVPLVLGPILFYGRKVRALSRASQDRIADIGAYVDETLHEINTVQAYVHEPLDRSEFSQKAEAVFNTAKQRIKYRAMLMAAVMVLAFSAISAILWLGGKDVLSGAISAGELSAFLFYAVLVAGGVATISEVIGSVQRAAGATDRLLELLRTQPEISEPVNPTLLPAKVSGQLSLQQVNFSYPNSGQIKTIQSLSLEIKPGERLALVGPSGAGKSTVFQLLLHFYLPDSGKITLDGVDITNVSPAHLRAQFALVPQESVIFATSVRENVRYARSAATDKEVEDACKAAYADEFIHAMPEQYDTQLGERGVRLSGGQKQRISIARAILADRPILLLDEATSALDAQSEQKVKQALDHLMAHKTTLIIAHRLATVVNADRILVMDQGRLQAQGTHDELLRSNELYRSFAKLQLTD